MNRQTLRSEIKTMVADLLEIKDFGDEEHFIRDLRADSMLLEELIVQVEKRYKVQIPNDAARNVRCLKDAVDLAARLLGVSA